MIEWLNLEVMLGEWASGVAGAAFAAAFVWLVRRGQAEILNRKFPVAGEYLTSFEDVENGQKVHSFAPATLKQRGKAISGETAISNKAWKIEGEIAEGGYLYGYYAAISPHDSGIGNFFLQMKDNGDLEGFWSGFDAENKVVTSGKYLFLKTPEYKVTDVRPEHVPPLLAISSKTLGEGYVQHILDDRAHESSKVFLAAIYQGKPIAYCYGYKVDGDEWADVVKGFDVKLPVDVRHCLNSGCLAVIQTVAVDPEYQGRGVASKLIGETMERLTRKGVRGFVSIAWKSRERINIKGVLERSKFEPVSEIANFWHEESLAAGYECPDCGNPCECSAILYKHTR